jgi:hypothetical protein
MNKDLVRQQLIENGYNFTESKYGFVIQSGERIVSIVVFGGWDQYCKEEGVRCEVNDMDSSMGVKYVEYRKTIKGIINYIKRYLY